MHIEVEEIIDNEDGSATLILDMDSEAKDSLLSFAVIEAIKNGLEMQEQKTEDFVNSLQLELDL